MTTFIETSSSPPSSAMDVDDLRELMRSVTETTQRLEATHSALQNEVSRLQQELAEANARIHRSRSLAALGETAAEVVEELRGSLGCIQQDVRTLAESLRDTPEQVKTCRKIDETACGLQAGVRRLQAICEQATAHSSDAVITSSFLLNHNRHMPYTNGSTSSATSQPEQPGLVCDGDLKLDDIERTTILATLQHYRGHRQKSAEALGIGVRTLGLKLRKWKDLKIVDETL